MGAGVAGVELSQYLGIDLGGVCFIFGLQLDHQGSNLGSPGRRVSDRSLLISSPFPDLHGTGAQHFVLGNIRSGRWQHGILGLGAEVLLLQYYSRRSPQAGLFPFAHPLVLELIHQHI